MTTSLLLTIFIVISSAHLQLNPHINQTSNGTWTITAFKIAVESVWYQDDLHHLLYLTAGNYHNIYFMDAFYFNDTMFVEITKTNQSNNIHHKYECQSSIICDYNCEVDGYNESYLQYSGQYKQLSPQFENDSIIYSYIGPALDALGTLPVIIYASTAYDNPSVLLYRGMDLLMTFGGLGRYYFPGNLYNKIPNYNIMKNMLDNIGCPNFDNIVDNFKNLYDEPELNINQYISMIGEGGYYDERNNIFGNTYYYIHNENHILNLTIDCEEYYRSYMYNETLGVMCLDFDHVNCSIIEMNYTEVINGFSGYPNDIAYNGKYSVLDQMFVDDANGMELDIFSGYVMFMDGLLQPIIKYFDSNTHLLLGMDVIKEGINHDESYDYNKTGYQRIWFQNVTDI